MGDKKGQEASVEEHGDAHAFDFASANNHHNVGQPYWSVMHGKPLIIFDVEAYAKNYNISVEAAEQKALVLPLPFLNHQTFWGTISVLFVTLLVCVLGRRKADQVQPKGRIQNMLEALVLFIRNDIVRPNVHHGDKWIAHFVSLFLVVLGFNLMGLVPGTGTASGDPGVTAGFATMTLVFMLFFGMKEQGVAAFWVNLIPVHFSFKPMDLFVWILLAIIELMGLIIKPVALAIRLFANMFAGHTVLLAFTTLGYILYSAGAGTGLEIGLGVAGFGLAFAISFLELLVAFIQAYVFTLLSAVFIGASIHPEH